MATRRMLIMRFSALGDVAMTIPAVYSLARRYPDLHIDFATTPFFKRIFINAPENLHVHGFDLKKEFRGLFGTMKLLRRLAALHPDCVADLHNVARTWVADAMFRLKGVRVEMVDKMRSKRSDVLKRHASQPGFISRYADVFARLGYPIELTFTSLFADEKPAPPIAVNHPAVGIAPFARYTNKTYPPDNMRRVVAQLAEQGIDVYLFGAAGREAEELSHWTALGASVHCVAGRFRIEEEIALMAEMDVMVSMDSANHHLASLVGVPVVSLWGSTTPDCGFMAYGQPDSNAMVSRLDCQPCSIAGKPECPLATMECFLSLRPAMIVDKIKQMLGQ